MAHLSDIEIARAANKLPIQEIGAKLDISSEHLLPYGHDKAKVSAEFIKAQKDKPNGKLILVTAITPLLPEKAKQPPRSGWATD